MIQSKEYLFLFPFFFYSLHKKKAKFIVINILNKFLNLKFYFHSKKNKSNSNIDFELSTKEEQKQNSQMPTMDSSKDSSSRSGTQMNPFKNCQSQTCFDQDKDYQYQNQNNDEIFNSSNSRSNSGKGREDMNSPQKQEPRMNPKFEAPSMSSSNYMPMNMVFAPMAQNGFTQGYQVPAMSMNNMNIGNLGGRAHFNNINYQQNSHVPVMNLLIQQQQQPQQQQQCLQFLPNFNMMNQGNQMVMNKLNIVSSGNNLYLLMPLNLNNQSNMNMNMNMPKNG